MNNKLKAEIIKEFEDWSGVGSPWESDEEDIEFFSKDRANYWKDQGVGEEELYDFLSNCTEEDAKGGVDEKKTSKKSTVRKGRLPLFEEFSKRSKRRRVNENLYRELGGEFFDDMLTKFVDTMHKDEKNAVGMIAYLNDAHPSDYEGEGVYDEASEFFVESLPWDYSKEEIMSLKSMLDAGDFAGMFALVKKHWEG